MPSTSGERNNHTSQFFCIQMGYWGDMVAWTLAQSVITLVAEPWAGRPQQLPCLAGSGLFSVECFHTRNESKLVSIIIEYVINEEVRKEVWL